MGEIVPQGQLIPVEEESYNHGARVCRVAEDGRLYIALGQPHNVPPVAKVDMYSKLGIGGNARMNADDTRREVFARGIRNSVGMDFNPKDKTLWWTDNQTDGLGDEVPPESSTGQRQWASTLAIPTGMVITRWPARPQRLTSRT